MAVNRLVEIRPFVAFPRSLSSPSLMATALTQIAARQPALLKVPAPADAGYVGRGADPRLQRQRAGAAARGGRAARHPEPQPRDDRASLSAGAAGRPLRAGAGAAASSEAARPGCVDEVGDHLRPG